MIEIAEKSAFDKAKDALSSEEMQKQFDQLIENTQAFAEAIMKAIEAISDAANKIIEILKNFDSLLMTCGDKRVVHLAFHSRKKKTRKKNHNRLIKEFSRCYPCDKEGNT